ACWAAGWSGKDVTTVCMAQTPAGCNSCHTKLSTQIPEGHFKVTVEQVTFCIVCHSQTESPNAAASRLGWFTHLDHFGNQEFDGTCWSCHVINTGGELTLVGMKTSMGIKVNKNLATAMTGYYGTWATSEFLDHTHAERGVTCALCHDSNFPTEAPLVNQCLKCHQSYAHVAAQTQDLYPNPHDSHMGDLRCTLCHHAHEKSTTYCNECHEFDFETP
ncbi:MAG: cytochrome c3 family protein, partial [Acidobacteria bacterium]|nr:cytochrome c3 family protein [Acidobacteriota bacterium]